MAMPAHKPTRQMREQVERMAGFGFTIEQIAIALDIGERTLYKYYSTELERGHISVNMKVVGKLFAATQRNDKSAVTAQIFWAKTRMGWKETDRHEHTGEDGEPIQHSVTVEFVEPPSPKPASEE
ncbi:MAG: hypothetical protein CGW95_00920 [Phenylobacterium zucineum]|nr:MAG: hypothetical protein CGW95_00920 [Phenylobacterium zucineum]